MKVSIELDYLALRLLAALALAEWGAFGGVAEAATGAFSLYLILKG